MSKQQLYTDIVGFLENTIMNGEVAGDEKESLEIAIDCIREIFKVSESAKPQDLLAIYEQGNSAHGVSANSTSTSATASSTTKSNYASASAGAKPQVEVSDADKETANQLKAKGNSLMAKHDFKGAADAYTQAIDKNPNNAVFFGNRAAAFAHLSLYTRAAEDAQHATEIDPKYVKAWSRLGLALWAQGDIEGALHAYESGLEAEGDNPSEGMKRDYENAKKRYDEETAKKLKNAKQDEAIDLANAGFGDEARDASAGAGAGAGSMGGFDFSSLASMMQNPQVQEMTKKLMSDPSALSGLMNSPMAQQMKQRMSGGNMPSMNELYDMMGGKQ